MNTDQQFDQWCRENIAWRDLDEAAMLAVRKAWDSALTAAMPQVDGEAISDAAVEAVLVARYGHMGCLRHDDFGREARARIRRDLAAALPHLSAPLPPQGAAVDWQTRWERSSGTWAGWCFCSPDYYERLRARFGGMTGCDQGVKTEIRALYAAPPPAALNEPFGNSERLAAYFADMRKLVDEIDAEAQTAPSAGEQA